MTGFESIDRNFPATVQNYGWELSLNSTNIITKDFKWNSHLNLTIPKNKLISFPDIEKSSYSNQIIVGKPITIQRTFRYLGVDPETGFYQFEDSKGDPTFFPDFLNDRTAIVNTASTLFGGFNNSFQYKGFVLDFLFQFVKQKRTK